MKFPYGISPASLVRWRLYERVVEMQPTCSPELARHTLNHLVDAELAAVERATVAQRRVNSVITPIRTEKR